MFISTQMYTLCIHLDWK